MGSKVTFLLRLFNPIFRSERDRQSYNQASHLKAHHALEISHMNLDCLAVVNQMSEQQLKRLLERIALVLEYAKSYTGIYKLLFACLFITSTLMAYPFNITKTPTNFSRN